MLISKKKQIALSLLLFSAIFFTLNEVINFVLKPYEGLSERIWSDFYNEQNIEMVYLGSSIGNRAYDPEVIDPYTGLKSFNLSSNSQPLIASYWGLKRALETGSIKYAILNVDYSNLESYESLNAKVSYVQALSQRDNLISQIINYSILARECGLKKKESVNIFFPWIYNHVALNRKNIVANIHKKLDKNYAAAHPESTDFKSRGHYEPKDVEYKSVNLDKEAGTNSQSFYKVKDSRSAVSKNAYKVFDKIINLCHDHHVQLVVTFAPRPAFDSLSLGDTYFEINDALRHYFENRGVPFYDLNMFKKNFWMNEDRYYYNFEHLNQYGSESFSPAFARFFNRMRTGEDVSSLFYTKEEYLKSIEYIAGVLLDTHTGKDEISIHVLSYQGLSVTPEYEIQVFDESSGNIVSSRAYSANPYYSFAPLHSGTYRIRVNARKVGSQKTYERYCEKKVNF